MVISIGPRHISSGDPQTGKRVYYDPFSFTPQCGHVFGSNSLLNSNDHDKSFYERWLVFDFKNSFSVEEEDVDYFDRIIEQELPQILNWFVQGAERLINRGHYELSKSHEARIAEWQVANNSVVAFLLDDEAWTKGPGKETQPSPAFAAYKGWCKYVNRKALGQKNFYKLLKAYLGVENWHKNGKGTNVIQGYELKPAYLHQPMHYHSDPTDFIG